MFTIVTDTSANLSAEFLQENHVHVIPYSYYFDGQEQTCTDTAAFDGPAFYDAMRSGVRVTTSQINPQRFIDHIEPLLQNGEDVLFISMSSGISGSYNSAMMAADMLRATYPDRRIRIVDTLSASLAEGIQVIWALEYQEKGMNIDEVANTINLRKKRMYQIFTVDSLTYLHRSGRISNATAIAGNVLQIKPVLRGNEEGKIVTCGKVRGRKKALQALAERYNELVVDADKQTVCIAHADCAEDAEYLMSLLNEKHPPKNYLCNVYEPVTGSHVGPGTMALFFESDYDCRFK